MKMLLSMIVLFVAIAAAGQSTQKKKERFPSYFGLQVRPVFPTRFIGEPETILTNNEFSTTISQKMGYSFGGTVRAGLTKLIAFETGINFTQRHFDISMSVADSNVFATNELTFIEYDIPLNGLVYVQMAEKVYMNASLGLALRFKPTDVGVRTLPGGSFDFFHTGMVTSKTGFDLNVNVGFEYRTEKSGFFYIGGSGRVPFAPVFEMIALYKYQGYKNTVIGDIDGSFLAIDIKYFFPNISNKGNGFKDGPIVQ